MPQLQTFTPGALPPVAAWNLVTLRGSDALAAAPLGKIKLHLAVWGSPTHRDSYGTWFDRANPPDLALDFLPVPLLYEHGMDGKKRKDIIGSLDRVFFDEIGIAGEGTLDPSKPYFPDLISDIRRKKLKTSSATANHIADFDEDGRFVRWYLSELSLTESPAESKMPIVTLVRSAHSSAGQLQFIPGTYPLERVSVGINTGEPLNLSFRSESIMPALQTLIESGQPIDPMQLIQAATADGMTPEELLAVLQQMTQPSGDATGELMSTTLADTPPPGAAVVPSAAITPVATTPAPAPVAPELLARLTELLQGRSNPPPGGVNLQTLRSQQGAPPVFNQYAPPTRQQSAPQGGQGGKPKPLNISVSSKFQHLKPDEMALGYMLVESALPRNARNGRSDIPVMSEEYVRAMAYGTALAIKSGNKAAVEFAVRSKFPFKSPDEVLQSDNVNSLRANEIHSGANGQGGEWIYDLQGTALWESIRQETNVYQAALSKGLDEAEIPQGYDSELIPLEGSDPTWYVAGGANDVDAAGYPVSTFSLSKMGTGQKAVTVAKLSVAMDFRQELIEDSIIGIVQEAQRKIRVGASEQIDFIFLNGDTALGANTNINKIDGTPTAAPAQPSYTLLDGVIKLALANLARDAESSFDEVDFLATFKKLPATHRQNRDKLLFVLDSDTGIAATNIATLKTRDVYSKATLEEGMLTSVWRIGVVESGFMYLANSAGKISTNTANNTLGRLLCFRPDQWASRWKRRLQTEVTYYPRADVTEVVAHMRWGLAYRDANAAAISYNIPTELA